MSDIQAAEIEEADTLDLPIDIVGDKVKSGRNILADYDPATGALEVRSKWKHSADQCLGLAECFECVERGLVVGEGLTVVAIFRACRGELVVPPLHESTVLSE